MRVLVEYVARGRINGRVVRARHDDDGLISGYVDRNGNHYTTEELRTLLRSRGRFTISVAACQSTNEILALLNQHARQIVNAYLTTWYETVAHDDLEIRLPPDPSERATFAGEANPEALGVLDVDRLEISLQVQPGDLA